MHALCVCVCVCVCVCTTPPPPHHHHHHHQPLLVSGLQIVCPPDFNHVAVPSCGLLMLVPQAARKEAEDLAREATAARESAAHELALMRRQLVSAQNALADSEKNLEEVRSGLNEEQNKNFKLEVEVAELRQKLGHMEELEKELEQFRRQAQEAAAKKGGACGVTLLAKCCASEKAFSPLQSAVTPVEAQAFALCGGESPQCQWHVSKTPSS